MDMEKRWVSLSEEETRVEGQSGGRPSTDMDDVGKEQNGVPGEPKRTTTVEAASLLVLMDEELAKDKGAIKEVRGESGGCSFRKPTEHRFSQGKER